MPRINQNFPSRPNKQPTFQGDPLETPPVDCFDPNNVPKAPAFPPEGWTPKKPAPIDNSRPLEGQKIMVDPGHGGSDIGARGPAGGHEADVALDVSLKLRDKLKSLGAEVRMTRVDDSNVAWPGAPQREELRARVAMANAWPADIFVSVHANASTKPEPSGTETYHSRNASQTSRELATGVHQEMVEATEFRDRGVRQANFYVIKNTHMPAILVETGFISNAEEEQKLLSPEMQQVMADAIAQGVTKVLRA